MDQYQDILGSRKLQLKFKENIIGLECEVLSDIILTDAEYANNSKYIRRRNTPSLIPIPSTSSRPFEQVSMDFLTDLPTTPDGFDSIMVMVDHGLTKGIILQPCNKTINALQTAEVIIQTIYRRF